MSVNMMSRLNFASLSVIVFVAVLIADVAAFGTGAPEQACEAARPWHTSSSTGIMYTPLESTNPYRFIVNGTEYVPGQPLQVTIQGTNIFYVYGFFLQARLVGNNKSIGMFDATTLPTGSQLRPCASAADAVTHTNPDAKVNLTFTWTPSNTTKLGSMRFVGSLALNHDDFYVGIQSDTIMEGSAATSLRVSLGALLLGFLLASVTKTD